MAVIVVSPGTGFLTKIGLEGSLIQAMQDHALKMNVGAKEFTITNKKGEPLVKGQLSTPTYILTKMPNHPGMVKAKATVSDAIQEAVKKQIAGSVPASAKTDPFNVDGDIVKSKAKSPWPTSKGTVNVDDAMSELAKGVLPSNKPWGHSTPKPNPYVVHADAAKKKAEAEAKAAQIAATAKANAIAAAEAHEAKMKAAGIIKLREATTLYQRVQGTSPSSVYVVVAVSPLVKVAARIKPGHLDVRAEGAFTDAIRHALQGQGFSVKSPKKSSWNPNPGVEYASGHFECENVAPDRVLGAILLGLQQPFTTPLPDLKKVAALGAE